MGSGVMVYGLCVLGGFALALLLVNLDDIKRGMKDKRDKKRYKKLLNGVPKRVVHLIDFDDISTYSKYPFYVNGQVIGVSFFDHWDTEDEYKRLEDKNGNFVGYITNIIVRSYTDDNGRKRYSRALGLSDTPSAWGKIVQVSAVVEVY